MTAAFDLIYVASSQGRTMSCAIMEGGKSRLIGPFPAVDAGPQIVQALLECESLGFADKSQAEAAYAVAHFNNMIRGKNDAAQEYPYQSA